MLPVHIRASNTPPRLNILRPWCCCLGAPTYQTNVAAGHHDRIIALRTLVIAHFLPDLSLTLLLLAI